MKALPFVTLVLCASFLVFQQASISSVTTSNITLQTRIDDVISSGAVSRTADGRSGSRTAGKSSRTKGSGGDSLSDVPETLADIDLEELAKAMAQGDRGNITNLKAMMRIQSLILNATPEELADLIKRTADLEIPDDTKQRLIGEIVGGLADQDPQAALEAAFASEQLDLDRHRWRFSGAFDKWIKQDPAAAIAWYDRELAKGSFESKSLEGGKGGRLAFEATAIRSLLGSNPAAAQQRLLALPEEQRKDVFEAGIRPGTDQAVAHAELLRATIPEEQQAEVFASNARDLLRGRSYADLADYTRQIEASDAEREAIVRSAVQRQFERFGWEREIPTAENVTEMQGFLRAEVPETANQITGVALARYAQTRDAANFEHALELVRDAHRATPNDEILVGFLGGAPIAQEYRPTAREMASQITDPTQRQAILERIQD